MSKQKSPKRSQLLRPLDPKQRQRQKRSRRDDATLAPKPRDPKRSNAELAEELHQRAIAQPYRLYRLHEILKMFNLDDKRMIHYRKLSARDPMSNPWIGDKTRPEKFAEWLWAKRFELEAKHPAI